MESLQTLFAYGQGKGEEYLVETFWMRYKRVAGMFVNASHAEKVLAETSSWSSVSMELASLSTESPLGADLFLSFCPHVVKEHVNAFMRDAAHNFWNDGCEISSESLQGPHSSCFPRRVASIWTS